MSFPRYPEYKDSGVEWLGEVPAHWETMRLAALFHEAVEEGHADLPILSVSIHDGVSDRELDDNELDRKVTRSDDRSKYKRVAPGDLVYNMMRAWQGGFGSVTVEGQVSPAYVVARQKSESACAAFVEHLLRTPKAIEEMRRYSRGVTDFRLRLYWEEFRLIRVPIPPQIEQSAILGFLDRETATIDTLIAEQERLIELLKEKRQAVISHAVTKGLDPDAPMKDSGVEWLGEVPAHWRVVRIKRLIRSIDQGWSPQCENYPVESQNEWGVLKVGCVNGGTFDPTENKALPSDLIAQPELGIAKDDLLVSRANTRELVGSAAISKVDHPNLLLCDKLYRLRLDRDQCSPILLALYLGLPAVRAKIEIAATGASSSMVNISQSTILDIEVALPPQEEHAAIEAQVDLDTERLDALMANTERAAILLKERRTTLISAAVTGAIDTRGDKAVSSVTASRSAERV